MKKERMASFFRLLTICFLSLSTSMFSQNYNKEKRIFLLDITKSMWGFKNATPNIFDEVKIKLYQGIDGMTNPETVITVIPFQGTTTYATYDLPSWTFTIKDKDVINSMKKTIDSYNLKTVPPHNTDIYSAIKKGQEAIDLSRDNYIYLLTDGKQSPKRNVGEGSVNHSNEERLELLRGWCEWAKPIDANLFYVMLTKASVDEETINIVEHQCNLHLVEGIQNIVHVSPVNETILLNLHDELKSIAIDLSANNWDDIPKGTELSVRLEDNTIFNLVESEIKIIDKKLTLNFDLVDDKSFDELRENNPQEILVPIKIASKIDNLKIVNPELKLMIKNKKERTVTIEFKNE